MRRIAGILATTTVVMLAAACGSAGPGTESGAKGGADVQVWALQDAAVSPIATASIDAYNKSSGNKVKLVTYVNDAYKQKLQVAMGSPQAPRRGTPRASTHRCSTTAGVAGCCPTARTGARATRGPTASSRRSSTAPLAGSSASPSPSTPAPRPA